MSAHGYEAEKKAIGGYASDVDAEVKGWSDGSGTIKSASLHNNTFTNYGAKVANAYEGLVDDYTWYAWRIGITLEKVAAVLRQTAKSYGESDAIVKDDINNVGKNF
jgi:hypothetical protein